MSEFKERKMSIRQAYMDAEAQQTRQRTYELYTEPKIDFPRWVLSRYPKWRGDERILDISPGNGSYFEAAQEVFQYGGYVASDVSHALLRLASRHPYADDVKFLVNHLEALPFADGTFDMVIADHILYQVAEVEATIAELHRVLKPTGMLLASTHSQYTMVEFDTLTRRALTLLGRPPKENISYYGSFIQSFSLENATMVLSHCFRAVARHEVPSTFIFREAKPVIDYLNSNRAAREQTLPPGVSWDDFIVVMSDQIRRLINHFGELTVNRLSGVLLATDSGGFAEEYFTLLDNHP